MEEERVIRPRVLHQPMHSPQNILLRRLAHGVLSVICESNHVLALVSEVAVQIGRHILHIVDAPSELASLPEVVDANKKRFAPAGTVGVLERIALRCAMPECYGILRRRRRTTVLVLRWGWTVLAAVTTLACTDSVSDFQSCRSYVVAMYLDDRIAGEEAAG